MPLYAKLPESLTEVDVIIAGGGTTACVVAGRLAAANPDLAILVIEYGKDNYDLASVVHPALFPLNLAPDSETAIHYVCEGGPSLNGRTQIITTGGVLGGGSSINFMMYTRAQRSDYNSWETEGWNTDQLLPYLQKLETYHGPGDKKLHGYNGPIHVSDGGFRCDSSTDDLLAAAAKVGYPTILDLQDLDSNNGFARWDRTISPDGKRQDAAHAYLHPLLRDGKHPNLHVLTETKVSRVLFESGRASGVEFVTMPMKGRSRNEHDAPQTVFARKLVVVSCGAVATPSVLERSGIGSFEILEKSEVQDQIVDLPGVGHDYQDHNIVFYPYKVRLAPDSTLANILGVPGGFEKAVAAKSPLIGWNTVDVCSKIRPSETEVRALGPEFQEAWDRDYKNYPSRPMMLTGLCSGYLGDIGEHAEGDVVSLANYTAYPYSRGSVHIQNNESGAPHFVPGFFTDKDDIDLKMQIWAYKKQREIMRRTEMYRGELAIGHPQFPEGSSAACINLPLDAEYDPDTITADLEYTQKDDKAIEAWLRNRIETTWHSLGTTKMAPREDMGVVDKDLNVYGVKGLKVMDLSIVPKNIGSNTCNTAFVIGEKGADIIAKELGFTLE